MFATLLNKKNKLIFLSSLSLFILVVLFFVLKSYLDFPFLNGINTAKFPSLTVTNESETFKISINKSKLFTLLKNNELQKEVKNIKVLTSDKVQENRNSWGNEPYSSITIKQIAEDRIIVIQIDIEQLKNAGWSERMIADEIEVLVLQGIILHKDLYTSLQMVNDARDNSRQLTKSNGFPNFVKLN